MSYQFSSTLFRNRRTNEYTTIQQICRGEVTAYIVVYRDVQKFFTQIIYALHAGRGVYICSRLFRILAHAELFGIFSLFLEEFDYTARVQHALVAIQRK